MKLGCLLIFIPILSACSLYESEGRKYLEAQGLQFAGVAAQSNLLSCDSKPSTTAWVQFEKNSRAELWTSDNETYELKVTPLEDKDFNCYFGFSSAQELYAKSSAATDLTLHLSLAH